MGSADRLTLNVGGQLFTTTADTLSSLPNTRLGRLAGQHVAGELFFDRNPEVVNSILDFYRSGELHLPKHLCGHTLERELRFWEIPTEMIHECCHKKFESQKEDAEITDEIHATVFQCYETDEEIAGLSKWNWIWLIMEKHTLCTASKIWAVVYFTMVIVSVLLFTLQTTMSYRQYNPAFTDYAIAFNTTADFLFSSLNLIDQYQVTESVSWLLWGLRVIYAFFILEFLVRFFTCPSKRYFIRQARNWVDVLLNIHNGLSIAIDTVLLKHKTDYTTSELNALYFFYAFSVLRIVRIFYLAKAFDAMKILVLSTRASINVLALLAVCVLSLAAIFGSAAYLAELFSSTFTFRSIPNGMWYAIVTMTTVGYGDIYPTSTAGRVVGTLCALCGVVVMALPISVLATTFSNYHDMIGHVHQRKRRAAFVKDNPEFRAHQAAETSAQEPPPETKDPGSAGKQRLQEKADHCNDDKDAPRICCQSRSCFDFGFNQRKLRRVRSVAVKVSGRPEASEVEVLGSH